MAASSVVGARKRRMETVSFRIDNDCRSTLEEESRRNGISLNALVSQIFGQYTSWGRYAGQLKLLPTTKDLMREVFQALPVEKVEEIGQKLGETGGQEQILFLFRHVTSEAVLRFMERWASHFDAYLHHEEGRRHFFTLHHDVNANFSLFIKSYVSSLIRSTIGKAVHFENVSQNAVSFSFEV